MKLNRRLFLGAAIAAPAMQVLPAFAGGMIDYTPDVLANYANSGEPYLLDFAADWCSTCAAQGRVLESLQAQNAAYDAIPIIRVDWDQHSSGPLARDLAIPRRSTLVLMQGNEELGRIVAQTGSSTIATLLDLAG